MTISSVMLMYQLIQKYIYPILTFANILVDNDGILRPVNAEDKDIAYTYEDKTLIIPTSNAKFTDIRSKKDLFEIFNPILIPKHCVFLANMVMNTCNALNGASPEANLVYDDDLDEWIVDESKKKTKNEKIEMFHMKDAELGVLNRIVFSKVDENGNPSNKIEAEFVNEDILIATLGAIINLIKKFSSLGSTFISTNTVMLDIIMGIQKYKKTKLKEKDESKDGSEINDVESEIELDSEIKILDDEIYAIDENDINVNDMYYLEDKNSQYTEIENTNTKVHNGLIFPSFKTITHETQEEAVRNAMIDLQEYSDYYDMEFID